MASKPANPQSADFATQSGEPPEAGQRASFDPVTGEAHGSGSGAGGGNPGEDHDQDFKSGNPDIPGGKPQEPVEDRENVGTVTPDDYPEQQ